MHRLKINRSSTMSSGKAPDNSRSLWRWGSVLTRAGTNNSSSTPPDNIPAASSVHVTSAEKHGRNHSSPEQVSDVPISRAPAVAHNGKPSRPSSHASRGGRGDDTGARPSSSRPSTARREGHTSEQTLDSSKNDRGVISHSPSPSAVPKPEKHQTSKQTLDSSKNDGGAVSHSHSAPAAPKSEKQPSKTPLVPSKSENMGAVSGGGAVDRVRSDTNAELSSSDRQILRVYLRLGLGQQRKAFNTYSKDLRNAYGTARTKDEIQDMITMVSKHYKDETDKNIEKQNSSVATFIKKLEPQFRVSAMQYWTALFAEFTNFLMISGTVAQEANAKSLKLTSKFWAVDKGLTDGADKAYDRAISKVDRF